jgi:hypothetical protein
MILGTVLGGSRFARAADSISQKSLPRNFATTWPIGAKDDDYHEEYEETAALRGLRISGD